MLNVIIAGLGGQGTITAARLIAEAAVAAGFEVRGSETIGMAQRGGSVTSHVRMGPAIFSPLIPPRSADIVIAFEPGEAVRAADFLKPEGVMVACDRIVAPTGSPFVAPNGAEAYEKETLLAWLRENTGRLLVADGEALVAACGIRCLNTALAGCALKTGVFPFSREIMEAVIAKKIKPQFVEQNLLALRAGMTGE